MATFQYYFGVLLGIGIGACVVAIITIGHADRKSFKAYEEGRKLGQKERRW